MTQRACLFFFGLLAACPAAATAQTGTIIQFTPTSGVPTFAVRDLPVRR